MSDKSITMALLAGLSQFMFSRMTVSDIKFAQDGEENSFKADLQKSLHIQMKYVLPVFIGVIAYTLSAGIALYWIVSNIFSIAQEYFFRYKKLK
jgi:YidC/Oxa1 family membrane protein insertase